MFVKDDEVIDEVFFPGYIGKVVSTKDIIINDKFPLVVDVKENDKVTKRFYYTNEGRINVNSKVTLFKNSLYHKMRKSKDMIDIVIFSVSIITFFISLATLIAVL